jgi:hypothetical protein
VESFSCAGEWIDLSNGAAESLLEAWERLALSAQGRPGMTALAAYLRKQLDHGGAGARAFGMDREFLPDELAGQAESTALLAVVEQTVQDPTLIQDVNWTPDLMESWRGRLSQMAAALRSGTSDCN